MSGFEIVGTMTGLTISERLMAEYIGDKAIDGIEKGRSYPIIGNITEQKKSDNGTFISITFLVVDSAGKIKHLYPNVCKLFPMMR